VGNLEGADVGIVEGIKLGEGEGIAEGDELGPLVVGSLVGDRVGLKDGL